MLPPVMVGPPSGVQVFVCALALRSGSSTEAARHRADTTIRMTDFLLLILHLSRHATANCARGPTASGMERRAAIAPRNKCGA